VADIVAAALDGVRRDLALGLTQELVRTPSVVGEEEAVGHILARQMTDLGFERVRLEEALPGRFNVIGEVDFGPGPNLVLTGHMDTKPVCVGWDLDPYGGEIVGERLYGHAIMDMKAGLACEMAAARALQDCRLPLAGRITLVAVCDHMGQQSGARHYFSQNRADMAVLGELTDNRVAIGHRGRYYWDITTYGRSAHTCHKDTAINAIPMAAKLLLEIEKIRYFPPLPPSTAALFGAELYTAVGRIYGGLPPEGPSMIPDNCTIRVDSRPQPGVEADAVRGVIEEAIQRVAAQEPAFRYKLVLADEKSPHLVDVRAPIVRYIRRASQIVQGGNADVVGMSWLGDTATFGSWVPTVIYGPGREPVYMPNEYLDFEEIETAAKVYTLTAAFALSEHLSDVQTSEHATRS
jgi:acetylornithine deacetylase/succinyl-diaminopimelate desuccinylase-like protein